MLTRAHPAPPPRSGNRLGPDGGRALAAGLERLTALQTLDMRWPWHKGGGGGGTFMPWGGGGIEGGGGG